jgi:hypothetical protein
MELTGKQKITREDLETESPEEILGRLGVNVPE